MDKKGQIAIFVIVAIVIVAVVLVVFMYPQISNLVAPSEISPSQYLEDCIKPEINMAVDLLAKQGGSQNPTAYINYDDSKVAYLCYASGYYKTCVVQEPLLISSFANELSGILTPKAERCMKNLITEYEKRGYSVSYSSTKANITLGSGEIRMTYISPMTIKKEDSVRTFDKLDAGIESGIYDLLSIATSVIDYEATYGDTEIRLYTQFYPNLKIEKIKLEDGIKIYKLTDLVTEETFQFAIRSLVWPPGYGL